MISIGQDATVLTMIHVYETSPERQQSVYDGLIEGLRLYGRRMAGHLSSSIHKSLDGLRVTSYSQWDVEGSKALFENPAALAGSLAWFAPLISNASRQDSHLYGDISTYQASA
ncbi:MAG: hypothetical protein H7145_06210 [Akkermansiaceae bacterium]|nr:hypothetical protein [Armatimonadota bacterium]